ncbi:MAG: HAD family hydrolase, partial [Gammaproteobacteria bacterium]
DWLTRQYQECLTPGAVALVNALQQAGKQIHIISGGILQALLPLAAPLNIPITHIHAVSLQFSGDGSYNNYDAASPLCQQHGKAVICRQLLGNGEHGAFIGDGITDLEAAAAGIDFIGFGGVVRRSRVEAAATVYSSESDMGRLLPLLLTPAELQRTGFSPQD